jgi:hypothetical protein
LLVAAALCAFASPLVAQGTATVTAFSSAKPGTTLPKGWQLVKFGPFKNLTEYKFVDDQGAVVLNAKADNAASGLVQDVKLDIKTAPMIQFRWKISKLVEGADNAVASKEDSPVRVSLGFEGDRSKLTSSEKTKSSLAKTATGREIPYAQLVYVWANQYPVGTVIPNPHTKRVQFFVAMSGNADVGKWVTIKRNVVEDFKKAFGEDPGPLFEVGVLTDTDNTGAAVEAWYGDIQFLPAP